MPQTPTTDEEVAERLYECVNYREMPYRSIYGVYQIQRALGLSLIEAYQYCLKLLLRVYEKEEKDDKSFSRDKSEPA